MIFFNNFGKKADGFAYCLVFKDGKISEGFFNSRKNCPDSSSLNFGAQGSYFLT